MAEPRKEPVDLDQPDGLALYVHPATLVSRKPGNGNGGGGTDFRFEATNLTVVLNASRSSPFHEMPDGASVYVEIGHGPWPKRTTEYPFKHFLDVAIAVDEDPENLDLQQGSDGVQTARAALEWINKTATEEQKAEVAKLLTEVLGLNR